MALSAVAKYQRKREYKQLKNDLAQILDGRQVDAVDVEDQNICSGILLKLDQLRTELDGDVSPPEGLPPGVPNPGPPRNTGNVLTDQPVSAGFADFHTVSEGPNKGAARQMVCRNGLRPLAKGETFASIYGTITDSTAPFGEYVRMCAKGPDQFTPASIRNTQTGGTDSAGGYLVPEVLSGVLIDKARAMMVTTQAGFTTFPLSSDNLSVPQVLVDPTYSAVAEAATIPSSDVTFGAALLVPKKIAGITNASSEVVEDGLDFAARLQDVIARSLANAVDLQLLSGDGTGANVLGLFAQPDIAKTSLAGPITREAIDAAVEAVQARNHEPNACILSPANFHALSLQQASTAGTWLGAPESSSMLTYYVSSAISDVELCVGDFSTYGIGIRTGLRLEIARMGGVPDAWTDDLVSFRAVSRVDGVPLDASGMQIIDSIT